MGAAASGCGGGLGGLSEADAAGPDSTTDGVAGDAHQDETSSADASSEAAVDSTTDAVLDATSDAVGDARAETATDAVGEANQDAVAEANQDAVAEANQDAVADSAPSDSGSDACLLDGNIPDASLGDGGATTATCSACLHTSCPSQASACDSDCLCQSQGAAFFACASGGQSLTACALSVQAGSTLTALVGCGAAPCPAMCGL